jgi:Trehalose utilisation.
MALLLFSEMTCADAPSVDRIKHIVLIAGPKEHEPGGHENLRTVKLLKVLLDRAPNLKNVETQIYFNGWPDDPAVLDRADTIVTFSEGEDGFGAPPVPFMTDERMQVMEKQMRRGCGFMTFHFSTFAPVKYAEQILEWGGGFFDWQGGRGEGGYFGRHGQGRTERWYSALSDFSDGALSNRYEVSSSDHPVTRGVGPFEMHGEYYYQIRFRENDTRLTPLLRVPGASNEPQNQVVAWAVQRANGGRGIGITPGHEFDGFQNDDFRKLVLNAIVWTADATVPRRGVASSYMNEMAVNRALVTDALPTLVVNVSTQKSQSLNAETIESALNSEVPRFAITAARDARSLDSDLSRYKLIVLNNCSALESTQNKRVEEYVTNGGGLLVISSPEATAEGSRRQSFTADRGPQVRHICRPVAWSAAAGGTGIADAIPVWRLVITDKSHPITAGISDRPTHLQTTAQFEMTDTDGLRVLAEASDGTSGPNRAIAFVFLRPNVRILQVIAPDIGQRPIENDVVSTLNPITTALVHHGALWLTGQR